LLEAGADAVINSKDFALLVANTLKDPADPGDWISQEECLDWERASFEDFVLEEVVRDSDGSTPDQKRKNLRSSLAKLNEHRASFEAELAEAGIPLTLLTPSLQIYSFFLMNRGENALDALELAWLRALSKGDETYQLRWARRDSFCQAQFSSLPFILGLALAAAENGLVNAKRPEYKNWYRRFIDQLFEGLVLIHKKFFGQLPRAYDGDNLPEGSGVFWTQEILALAAEHIDDSFIQLDSAACEWRSRAICLVKQVSQLAPATIADRLEEANKAYEPEVPENADLFDVS
jgi:hypothetical protein